MHQRRAIINDDRHVPARLHLFLIGGIGEQMLIVENGKGERHGGRGEGEAAGGGGGVAHGDAAGWVVDDGEERN